MNKDATYERKLTRNFRALDTNRCVVLRTNAINSKFARLEKNACACGAGIGAAKTSNPLRSTLLDWSSAFGDRRTFAACSAAQRVKISHGRRRVSHADFVAGCRSC